jgi:signal transduction histidine kinase/CheY-like chemotaxis protein
LALGPDSPASNGVETEESELLRLRDEVAKLRPVQLFFDCAPINMGVCSLIDDRSDWQNILTNNTAELSCPGCSHKRGSELFAPSEKEVLLRAMRATMEDKHPHYCVFRHNVIGAAAEDGPMLQALIAPMDHSRLLWLTQDVTDLQAQQEELERAVKTRTKDLQEALEVKGRFLAMVSHEIRTPLAGILGSMELLQQTELLESQHQLLDTARSCGEQLSSVINDILQLSRLQQSGIVELDNAPFLLRELLEEVLEICQFAPSRKELEIILDVDEELPDCVVGDSKRLRQILLNLMCNAVKFTDPCGEVQLVVTMSHDAPEKLVFEVLDNGIGIASELQPNIFQPFFQGDSSSKRRFGGSGLGLAISKHLSTLMQGELTFKSQPGRGTTFTLRLPLIVAPSCKGPARPTSDCARNMAVLVVDPNAAVRRVLQRKLLTAGYAVRSFPCAASAIQHAETVLPSPRLVILAEEKEAALLGKLLTHPSCTVVRMGYDRGPREGLYLRKPFVRDCVVLRLVEEAAKKHLAAPPQEKPKPRGPSSCAAPGPAGPTKLNRKILVAEDNASNQLIIKRYLAMFGFEQVDLVENGLQAVQAEERTCYDLILMDLMMPIMDGLEATKIILQRPRTGAAPIIVALTAHAFEEDRAQCLHAGMRAVLTKPVSKQALLQVLDSVGDRCGNREASVA